MCIANVILEQNSKDLVIMTQAENENTLILDVSQAEYSGAYNNKNQRWQRRAYDQALKNEFAHGVKVIQSGETQSGAVSFKQGAGRHGQF